MAAQGREAATRKETDVAQISIEIFLHDERGQAM